MNSKHVLMVTVFKVDLHLRALGKRDSLDGQSVVGTLLILVVEEAGLLMAIHD